MRSVVKRLPVVVLAALLAGASACGDDSTGSTDASTMSMDGSMDGSTDGSVDASTVPRDASAPSGSTVASTPSTASTVSPGVQPEGFALVPARATAADGTVCELCLWLADESDDRARGLMGVTDLGPADGMAFRYVEPTSTAFTMRNTLIPLSIVFYGAAGGHLDAFDMVPCEAEPCPTYPTPEGFTVAVEVPAGDLEHLSMTPGSTLVLLEGGCSPT